MELLARRAAAARRGDGGHDVPADARLLVKARIDSELHVFAEDEIARLESIDPQLKPVGQQLRAAVADGKRIRGAFCYWGWRACGHGDSQAVIRAAAAIELVHAAALVHDDVIDDSPIRRGSPAAHVALLHAVADVPDREASARSLAILAGDLLMAWAVQLFLSCGLPAAYVARARPMLAELAREGIAGACLEIMRSGASLRSLQLEDSLTVARYKTAKYTVERPLLIGGRLGGATRSLLSMFSAYGVPLGEAFQLRDDLLAVYGDPERTGKSNLDDIAAARPTALMALALAAAEPADRAVLMDRLGRRDLGTADLHRVRDSLDRAGARAKVEALIAERAQAARAAIGSAGLPRGSAQALLDLVAQATDRAS